jgi:hypothetical protein
MGYVKCQIDNSQKEGVTVIAGIDAAGTQLPLPIIGEEKTKRGRSGFHAPNEVWKNFSESRETTFEVMSDYPLQLRKKLFPDGPLLVILDAYSVHHSNKSRAIAEACSLDLIFIPRLH